MTTGPLYRRVLRRVTFALATGSFTFAVASGCDPQVRTTVLSGFQDLATTFVDAFFMILSQDDSTATTA